MATAQQRKDKYEAKINSEVFKKRYDDTKKLSVEKSKAAVVRQVEIEHKVKRICSGVSSIQIHAYIIFANEFWKHEEDLERTIIYNKWTARGLNANLLDEIGTELFSWATSPSWYWDETSFWDTDRWY